MRKAQWAFVLLTFVCASIWAQQAEPVPQPAQTETIPITPYKPVQLSETDQMQACPAKFESHPELDGIYKVGGDVKWPKPIHEVNASFSDEARQMIKKLHLKYFEAVSLVSVVVDPQGNPQVTCVMKPAGYGLDQKAIVAAKQYRFQPATKNGVPVAVRISIEMNFRTY